MWRKIKRFFYNLLYSLPFGMKAADELLSTQTINDDVGIVESIRQNRLSEGLINGEVTQQVEELRYRDYKVYRESKKYKYLGDGIAIKKDIKECVGKINFIQTNRFITNTFWNNYWWNYWVYNCKKIYDEIYSRKSTNK